MQLAIAVSPMEPKRLRGWLLRIAGNLQTDLLRKKGADPYHGS